MFFYDSGLIKCLGSKQAINLIRPESSEIKYMAFYAKFNDHNTAKCNNRMITKKRLELRHLNNNNTQVFINIITYIKLSLK